MNIQQVNVERNQAVQRLEAILWWMEMLLSFPGGTEYSGANVALRSAVFEARGVMHKLSAPRYQVILAVRNVEFPTQVDYHRVSV